MQRVRYEARDGVGWIDLDDGQMNVLSPAMQGDIIRALDRAAADGVVTVLRGRPGVFSAGFDLSVLRGGDWAEARGMVLGGFELARRVLSHPHPTLIACTGHAVAMGLFLVLSGDYRVGTTAPAKLSANEVAIGLTLPRSADVLLRQRLTPAAYQRAAILAVTFDPEAATRAGALDELVDPSELDGRIEELARTSVGLDLRSHQTTKARVRAPLLAELVAAIADDRAEYEQRS